MVVGSEEAGFRVEGGAPSVDGVGRAIISALELDALCEASSPRKWQRRTVLQIIDAKNAYELLYMDVLWRLLNDK